MFLRGRSNSSICWRSRNGAGLQPTMRTRCGITLAVAKTHRLNRRKTPTPVIPHPLASSRVGEGSAFLLFLAAVQDSARQVLSGPSTTKPRRLKSLCHFSSRIALAGLRREAQRYRREARPQSAPLSLPCFRAFQRAGPLPPASSPWSGPACARAAAIPGAVRARKVWRPLRASRRGRCGPRGE